MWQGCCTFFAFIMLGFMAKQRLMGGTALVWKTTGEEGEEVTVKPQMKRGAPAILSPSRGTAGCSRGGLGWQPPAVAASRGSGRHGTRVGEQ